MYIRKTYCIYVLFLFFSIANLHAEGIGVNVRGKVLGENSIPLHGAHVSIPSLERGTITDKNGEFSLSNIPVGTQRFAVSHVGYEPLNQLVDISSNMTELNFTLKQTAIETEAVVITGNPYAKNSLNTPQDISAISGRDKLKLESTSLGKTIESIPGVYNLSAGSVAGKPVVRGYSGERVLILSDGISLEYQQYGERHAPNIEVNNYDRIEVVKGASSFLYGSEAMGGAVNLISHPYHFSTDSKIDLTGRLSGNYFSNNNEFMTALNLNASGNFISIFGNVVRRKADINVKNCQFCHIERMTDKMKSDIESRGFHIIEMDEIPSELPDSPTRREMILLLRAYYDEFRYADFRDKTDIQITQIIKELNI
jgi:hypothetical protein